MKANFIYLTFYSSSKCQLVLLSNLVLNVTQTILYLTIYLTHQACSIFLLLIQGKCYSNPLYKITQIIKA